MAVIVEDGSIVTNANSYVSEAELTAFATARGVTLVTDETILLIKAMDYIESLNYIGTKYTQNQSLQWPRYGVYIDTYPIDTDVIPEQLKNGLMQTAIAIDEGNDPLATLDPAVQRERVDVVEVTYMPGGNMAPIIKKINSTLAKLLRSNPNGNIINVGKA